MSANGLRVCVLVLFALALALAVTFGKAPVWVAALYLALSLVTLLIYQGDKRAARISARRTPELSLHLLALAGGWPGALLGQLWLRHKTSKPGFQPVFWMAVALNCALLAALLLAAENGGVAEWMSWLRRTAG